VTEQGQGKYTLFNKKSSGLVSNSLFSCLGRRRAVGSPSVISNNFIRYSPSMSRILFGQSPFDFQQNLSTANLLFSGEQSHGKINSEATKTNWNTVY
jgi:hypothetical protein